MVYLLMAWWFSMAMLNNQRVYKNPSWLMIYMNYVAWFEMIYNHVIDQTWSIQFHQYKHGISVGIRYDWPFLQIDDIDVGFQPEPFFGNNWIVRSVVFGWESYFPLTSLASKTTIISSILQPPLFHRIPHCKEHQLHQSNHHASHQS